MTQAYGGPTSLTGAPSLKQKFWGETKDASDTAKSLQNDAGRFTLLNSYFGNNSQPYSMGQKSLDNLLAVNTQGFGH
jgi:hypothetical protein